MRSVETLAQWLLVKIPPYTTALYLSSEHGSRYGQQPQPVITKLATGELLRIDDASGQSIAVVQGMVWITQEGDQRDVFLSDGENFVFDRPGTALVQAMNDTRLLALVGESAELIEHAAPASTRSGAPFEGHRGLAARAQLHRELASSVLTQVPAHRLAYG